MASKKSIKGVLVANTETKTTIKPYVFEQTTKSNLNLERIYAMLECSCIDVATRKFGNNYYDIYCDDEGLFKKDNLPTIATFDDNGNLVEQIVGNVFVCKHDGEGGMESLTDSEIQEVLKNLLVYQDHNGIQRVCLGAAL